MQALAAAPQLLTMKAEAVRARHELLTQLAQLQPAWAAQLAEASKETLAVWLCSRCARTHGTRKLRLRLLQAASWHACCHGCSMSAAVAASETQCDCCCLLLLCACARMCLLLLLQ